MYMGPRECWSELLLVVVIAGQAWHGTAWAEPVAGASAPESIVLPPPGPATLPQLGVRLPSNGSVLVDHVVNRVVWWTVTDFRGTKIPIDMRTFGRYWLLTPQEPQQPDTALHVEIGGDRTETIEGTIVNVFLAVIGFGPARSPRRPELSLAFEVALQERDTTMDCCAALPGYNYSRTCFVTRTTGTVVGTATLVSSEDASALTQVLFRVRPLGSPHVDEAEFQPLASSAATPLVWESGADEYCIELDAVDLTSGEPYLFPEISPRCVPHGALGVVGERARQIDTDVLAHSTCQVPPSSVAKLWCQTNQASCESSPASPGCEAYGHVCRGEKLPRNQARGRVMPMPLDQGCSALRARGSLCSGWLLFGLLWCTYRRRACSRRIARPGRICVHQLEASPEQQ